MSDTITREQMRELAEKNKDRNDVYGLIKRAACDGRTAIMYVGFMPTDVELKLAEGGFTIRTTTFAQIISWD